jgi:hypothetical protein
MDSTKKLPKRCKKLGKWCNFGPKCTIKWAMGRPKGSKRLTKELTNAICDILEKAVPAKYAAEANGISEGTFGEWMRQGAQGSKPYIEFFHAVSRARAMAVVNMHVRALEGGKGSGAAMWFLERRYREYASPAREAEKEPSEIKIIIEGGLPKRPR